MQFNLDLWPLVGGRTVRAIIYVPPEKFSSLQWPLRGHCKLETNRTNRGGAKRKALFTRAGGMGTLKAFGMSTVERKRMGIVPILKVFKASHLK